MYESLADVLTSFGLAGADRLNILLIQYDVIRPHRQVKYAFLRRRHTIENA